jgi:hypothetical protein
LYDDLLGIFDEEKTPTTPSAFGVHPSLAGGEAPQMSEDNRGASPPDKGEYPAQRGEGVGVGLRFEVHSYTGSPEYLQKFLDRGAYVSFNGIVTFDKTGNMEKLVKLAPLDKILLETDCPYLAPVPMRGKRNEPSFVKFVADKIALIKSVSLDEIAEVTTRNARKLFKI